MDGSKSASAIADVKKGLILATIEIAASPEHVFEALFNAQDAMRWCGVAANYRTTGVFATRCFPCRVLHA
jgi:uncharacterized protein YndB with AHSA1/START domain